MTVSYAIPVLVSVPITSPISIILDVISSAIDLIVSRAKAIEQAMHAQFGSPDASYKEKIRYLFVNLKYKGNSSLREGIVSGELSPENSAR